MIDYKEFCRGYERGYRCLASFRLPLSRYVELYQLFEKLGDSNKAGYWAGRLTKLRGL